MALFEVKISSCIVTIKIEDNITTVLLEHIREDLILALLMMLFSF